MNILIVGAGIAGLSLAALLEQRGFTPTIIEQAPILANMGYSIGIWHNGRQVLREIGVEQKFDDKGWPTPAMTIADGNGNILRRYQFENFRKEFWPPRTEIHRADLHNLLRNKVKTKIAVNTTVSKLDQQPDSVTVTFTNGKTDEFDFVVGADGINSQIRKTVFGEGHLKYLGWRGWLFWIEENQYPFPPGVFEMWEPEQFFGIFPHGDKKISTYLIAPFSPKGNDLVATRKQRLQDHFTSLRWLVPEIIENIDPKTIHPTDLGHVYMDKWWKGNTLLIGDAAHAMEPFAGMGASMAMEDSLVLAQELEKTQDISQVFLSFMKRRKHRVDLAQAQTRQLWRWTKVHSPFLRKFRNICSTVFPIQHFTKKYAKLLHNPI